MLRLKVKNRGVLRALRKMPFVEYVEPAYIFADEGEVWDSGCGIDGPKGGVQTISTGDIMAGPLFYIGVDHAWARSTGAGVTVGVVGTGVSKDQPQLNGQFTDGQSGGRTIQKDAVWDDGTALPWHDDCGHETRIIGNIAAPRDGKSTVGIAYGASIYSGRVDNDVLIQEDSWYVQEGIKRAARADDDGSEYKGVVNMALGWEVSYDGISDRIEYEHQNTDAVFIGAAGTSTRITNGEVEFPANMDQVVAVTGLDPDGSPCNICHYGPKVELAARTNQTVLHPYKANKLANMDGSSHATGVISGLAALVRSRYPSYDRDQVVSTLKNATHRSLIGDNRSGAIGWGQPIANCAVGGLCEVSLNGPTVIETSGNYTYTADQLGNTVSASYEWYFNGVRQSETSSSITLNLVPKYNEQQSHALEVKVTDNTGGFSGSDTKGILVRASNSDDCPPDVLICP